MADKSKKIDGVTYASDAPIPETLIQITSVALAETVIKRWPSGTPEQSSRAVRDALYALMRAGYIIVPSTGIATVTQRMSREVATKKLVGGMSVEEMFAGMLTDLLMKADKAGLIVEKAPADGDYTLTMMAVKLPALRGL